MDGISIAGLVLGVASGLVLFIKSIRKCKCTKQGISLERESNDELGKQQDFTIKLIELLQAYPKQCQENVSPDDGISGGGRSEISEEVAPEIKDKMLKMLEILNTADKSTTPIKRTKTLKAILVSKNQKDKEEEIRNKIRQDIEREIREKIELELQKRHKEEYDKDEKGKKITQFIITNKKR